jgi:hypothetical protein
MLVDQEVQQEQTQLVGAVVLVQQELQKQDHNMVEMEELLKVHIL